MALVTGAAVVVAVALIVLNMKPAPATGDELVAPQVSWASSVTADTTAGQSTAPVTLEVYADFQCPVCGRFVREQLPGLKSTFVDTGVLYLVSHDIAILGTGSPDESVELAVGARCAAAQGRYWSFHDYLFWNQRRENRGDYSPAFIASLADAAGVDRGQWDACVAGTETRAAVIAASTAALTQGINSTPTLVLNGGTPVPGLPDPASLVDRIRQAAAASPSSAP